MIQLDQPGPTIGRVTAGLALSSLLQATWSSPGARWEGPGALMECRDADFLPTFSVLVVDLLRRLRQLGQLPKWSDILEFLEDWEALFARTFVMDDLDQLGLWGELKLIRHSSKIDDAIAAWIADSSGRTDFMRNSISLEVKASRRRGQHHVSITQVDPPSQGNCGFLVSMWVELEESSGESIPELVQSISNQVQDSSRFERKLLTRGYSRRDAAGYSVKWKLLEYPKLYAVEGIPRVRTVDPGISNIRYLITLNDADAVNDVGSRDILDTSLAISQIQ